MTQEILIGTGFLTVAGGFFLGGPVGIFLGVAGVLVAFSSTLI